MLNDKWRSYCLTLTAIAINLTAIYALWKPDASNRSVADFKFPQELELAGGKAIVSPPMGASSNSQLTSEPQSKKVAIGQKYQYIRAKMPIALEISYLVDTQGDVKSYLKQYTQLPQKAIADGQIEYIKGVGYHLLLQTSDRAYLSSCISPRSPSNVTQRQFSEYRYQNDLKLDLFWQWLQGKTSIRDRRCLWVNLSTPLNSTPQTAHEVLETTWQELYMWWLPNFPPLD